MQGAKWMSPVDRAELVSLLIEARYAVGNALREAEGDEMFKDQKDRCEAAIEQAKAKLAYAWNALHPFIET